jgi:hypothetical protein
MAGPVCRSLISGRGQDHEINVQAGRQAYIVEPALERLSTRRGVVE